LLTAAARVPAPLIRQSRPAQATQRGGISLMLDERQVRYAIAYKAADGTITQSCEPATESANENAACHHGAAGRIGQLGRGHHHHRQRRPARGRLQRPRR
jgi:hypothetical protein